MTSPEPPTADGTKTEESPLQLERRAREAEIRAACEAGDYERGVTVLLQTYAEELLSFLIARLGDRSHAEDAFSGLMEDLWLSLPSFEFRSSARTWAYTVTRHAAARYARAPVRRRERNLTFSKHVQLSELVEQLRTRTEAYRRTDAKNRVRALRQKLDPEDQTLLILRVDRQMGWRDLAQVMGSSVTGDAPEALDEASLDREAARLRKRFSRVKDELKRLAKQEGLL